MLKKLAATGVLAATATGVMLLAGPANAGSHATAVDPCITVPGLYQPPAWCNTYNAPPTYYAPPVYYPPTTYYPGYGWDRWHHGPWHYHH